MRSSIACARCRRSKVKCINNGVNTTCKACETTGRECTYPPPAVPGGGGAARREGSSSVPTGPDGSASGGEATRRHRPRRSGPTLPGPNTANKESPRALLDALDPTVLTPKVWTELFDIFQQHFSTDLPFLHPPTFLKPLRQSTLQPPQVVDADFSNHDRPSSSPMPPCSPILLLAFLTLTARFHPQLVAYHSPPTSTRPSNPLVASEYYNAAARSRISGHFGEGLGTPDLERTQALLMLGLYEWGMCRGARAWVAVGVAVRCAQLLGLQFEQDLDDMPLSRSLALEAEAYHLGVQRDSQGSKQILSKSEAFIEQEMKRRTFWSCFVMDRYLSSGKYRPQMLNVKDLRIQLPSSERAFLFGEKVRTLLLGEELDDVAGRAEVQSQRHASVLLGSRNGEGRRESLAGDVMTGIQSTYSSKDDDHGRWEIATDEGILSRYIKVLDLYGRIVKWSCGGGRRRECFPPWDPRSTFFSLQKLVTRFRESLPRDLTLTPANISAHITSRTSTPYTLMHTALSLCTIMLHREYMPFIPLRCTKPQGPLDPPLFPPDDYAIPAGFWDESAHALFRSARELIDLLRTCEEWGVLVETPIVGFATYTAAFVGVYAINFSYMDPDGFVCARSKEAGPGMRTDGNDLQGAEAARKALEIVGKMRKRLQMADGWFRTIKRVHLYYARIKKDFRRNAKASTASDGADSPEGHRHLSLREGGAGGGLEEYKLLEKTLKEFGSLEDEDLEMLDSSDADGSRGDGSDAGSTAVKSEGMDIQEGTPDSAGIRQDRWNAINTVAAAAAASQANGDAINHQSSPFIGPSTPQQLLTASTPSTRHDQSSYTNSYNQTKILSPTQQTSRPPANAPLNYPEQQGQQQSMPLQQIQNTTPDFQAKENWLNNLDTRFGGDDIAAFVAGNNWQDWAGMAANKDGGGWLSVVWGAGATAATSS